MLEREYRMEINGTPFRLPYQLAGTPLVPANFNGNPDNWAPEEGGDFEVIWGSKSLLLFRVLEELSSEGKVDKLKYEMECDIKDYVNNMEAEV
jgi:hypothetical protein